MSLQTLEFLLSIISMIKITYACSNVVILIIIDLNKYIVSAFAVDVTMKNKIFKVENESSPNC